MQEQQGEINNIINHLFANGWGWGMFGLFLFGLFWAIYRQFLSDDRVKEAVSYWIKKRAYKVGDKDLKNHKIFSIKSRLRNKVDIMFFENAPLKTKVFRVFFKTKLDVDIQKIKEFTQSDFKNLDRCELHIKMIDLIDDMKATYDVEVKAKLKELCECEFREILGDNFKETDVIACSEKIFKYAMYAPNGYEHFRNYRIENLLYDTEDIKESPIYDDNNERVYQFLLYLAQNIERTISRAAKIHQGFNGEIDRIFNSHIKGINKI